MNNRTYAHRENDDEIVIDLRALFYEFKRKIWLILAALIVGTAAAGAYSYFLVTPQYTSEAKIYVLSKETTLTSLADLQMGTQLTQDYKVLIGSRPVMQEVIDTLNLDLNYRQLAAKMEIENPKDTRVLYLTVTDPDPYMAKAIVDAIANAASDYIGEIMEMTPPKLIEDGVVPSVKTSPNVKKTAAMGGLAAMLLVCGMITLTVLLNDSIQTEEDVMRYLELPTLAILPERRKQKEGEDRGGARRDRKGGRRKRSASVYSSEGEKEVQLHE